jgi:hypothetical protein
MHEPAWRTHDVSWYKLYVCIRFPLASSSQAPECRGPSRKIARSALTGITNVSEKRIALIFRVEMSQYEGVGRLYRNREVNGNDE